MLLRRARSSALSLSACLCALLLLSPRARAQSEDHGPQSAVPHPASGAVGSTSWGVQLGFYDVSDDGGGNPFVDEDVTVLEPVVYYDYQASEDTGYWAMFSYDQVSSASIERVKRFGQQSGASGDFYLGLNVGMRHALDENRTANGHIGVSTEYDYNSIGLGGSLDIEAQDRNSTLSFGLDGYFDSLDMIRWDGSQDGTDQRVSIAGTIGYYRVLNPLWHGQFGLTVSSQSGFLGTPINSVVIEDDTLPPNDDLLGSPRGTEADEALPDTRLRSALYGRARRSLGPYKAFEIGGRLYDDDWGIQAYSVEPGWIQELVPERLLLRVRYRYYEQTAADAYHEHLSEDLKERTQDPELAALDSHTLSTDLEWTRPGGVSWDLGLSYMQRSDNLDHIFGLIGWHWSF